MKYIVVMLLALATVLNVGCDEGKKGDGVTTRACWFTVDETNTYTPHGHKLKLLRYGDVCEINQLLGLGKISGEVVESPFRTICLTSQWVLTDYSAPPFHYWPFQVKIGDVWVDSTKSVTIELHTNHCPKPNPTASWHPYTREEIAEKEANGDYDIDDPNDQGYWVYSEVECPCED